MPRAESPEEQDAAKQQEANSIDDYELPKTVVTRIAKAALPENIKLQKEAVTALVTSSTVFINYLAATAQDISWGRSAKTVTGADVLKALEIIEFDDQIEPMKRELEAWKAQQDPSKGKGKAKRQSAADEASAASTSEQSTKRRRKGARPGGSAEHSEDENMYDGAEDGFADGPAGGAHSPLSDGMNDELEGEADDVEEDAEEEEEEPPEDEVPMDIEHSGLLESDEEDGE